MPPKISGTRVAIGGGSVGSGGSMKNSGGSDYKTFESSGGKGSSGSPVPKGGAKIGNSAEGKFAPIKSPVVKGSTGLERTAKSGTNLSAKPQPTIRSQKQGGTHGEGFAGGGRPSGK